MEQSIELNDNELIYLISMKNENAYLMLLNKYSNMMHSVINKYQYSCGFDFAHDDAYAICLEIFDNTIINYRDDVAVSFSTYLFRCLNNRMINYQKKIKKHNSNVQNFNYQIDEWEMENVTYKSCESDIYYQYDPARSLNKKLVYDALSLYIKAMNANDREMLLMYLDGLRIKDISIKMNLDLRYTGTRLRKIRKNASISLESYKNN